MACSRSTLTLACNTMTQRQPMLWAAAARARPWLPSVALMTVKSANASACLPSNRSCGAKHWSEKVLRIKRTRAIGAPNALKLPNTERSDSSFTRICSTPRTSARSGSE
ncbi:hypothetical protein D9M71_658360 [compost metagenome]